MCCFRRSVYSAGCNNIIKYNTMNFNDLGKISWKCRLTKFVLLTRCISFKKTVIYFGWNHVDLISHFDFLVMISLFGLSFLLFI